MNIRSAIKNNIQLIIRLFKNMQRPSRRDNMNLLRKKGETIESFYTREANADDIPALVQLHVITWNATYPGVKNKPTHEIRDYEWRKAFETKDLNWFCLVIVNKDGNLIGFAQANAYEGDLPMYAGQLNKIYLLEQYQRLGFGKMILCRVVQKFLENGINSMILFSEPQNPSGKFYEKSGAVKIYADNGDFHGAYGWKDLNELHSRLKCT
ncbi:MAG: N-acetyltransferase family protein [Flavisolibacter sp.]